MFKNVMCSWSWCNTQQATTEYDARGSGTLRHWLACWVTTYLNFSIFIVESKFCQCNAMQGFLSSIQSQKIKADNNPCEPLKIAKENMTPIFNFVSFRGYINNTLTGNLNTLNKLNALTLTSVLRATCHFISCILNLQNQNRNLAIETRKSLHSKAQVEQDAQVSYSWELANRTPARGWLIKT